MIGFDRPIESFKQGFKSVFESLFYTLGRLVGYLTLFLAFYGFVSIVMDIITWLSALK